MTWGSPPAFQQRKSKVAKLIAPEQLAASGTEDGHQAALFCWAALNVGKYPALAYMFAIPNGGLRDVRTATNLKAEGVKAGVPDIFLPFHNIFPHYPYSGCFIAMKLVKYLNHNNGGFSDFQIYFINYPTSAGYYCKF